MTESASCRCRSASDKAPELTTDAMSLRVSRRRPTPAGASGSAHSLFDLPLDRDEPRYCCRRPHTKPRERLSPILIISFNMLSPVLIIGFSPPGVRNSGGFRPPARAGTSFLEGALADQSADRDPESITKNETLGWKKVANPLPYYLKQACGARVGRQCVMTASPKVISVQRGSLTFL
jgi:hypothetical protein